MAGVGGHGVTEVGHVHAELTGTMVLASPGNDLQCLVLLLMGCLLRTDALVTRIYSAYWETLG